MFMCMCEHVPEHKNTAIAREENIKTSANLFDIFKSPHNPKTKTHTQKGKFVEEEERNKESETENAIGTIPFQSY